MLVKLIADQKGVSIPELDRTVEIVNARIAGNRSSAAA
jgi:hypothetical protein